MQILGVRIDGPNEKEALAMANQFLSRDTASLIFTPNPEMLVKATTDRYFFETLNKSALNICDGFGLRLVAFFKKIKINRLAGVDFMQSLCKVAEEKNIPIYLLGGAREEVVLKTSVVLKKNYPKLQIVGESAGIAITEGLEGELVYEKSRNDLEIAKINNLKPQLIFVAFGMGKQEKWLFENIDKLPSVKIGMGVGGSFDYISKVTKRAPLLMRKIGLEWAYRLIKQPKRFGRIINATVKFIYLVLTKKTV
ncbi:MAG: WecB/TagA/CpsF family glycosyltransferase [Patescibacteria group bacterium]|jgi:N-acetylglucosaminyldiphosphoundecaprenol N-acetyl-beta-D-mannosaminyltransferase